MLDFPCETCYAFGIVGKCLFLIEDDLFFHIFFNEELPMKRTNLSRLVGVMKAFLTMLQLRELLFTVLTILTQDNTFTLKAPMRFNKSSKRGGVPKELLGMR